MRLLFLCGYSNRRNGGGVFRSYQKYVAEDGQVSQLALNMGYSTEIVALHR